jgi:deoxyinosine 3'endonuclease (endonuclease V)
MLKAAVDVYYKGEKAKAVCILFEHWASKEVLDTYAAVIQPVAAYEPGAFYKRELPCILNVLQQIDLSLLDVVVVDGYVYLDDEKRKGLGAHLYEALQEKTPIIGVAKRRFHQNAAHVLPVYRGGSRHPLIVTSVGIEVSKAATAIQSMTGIYRMPDLLQYLDRKTREDNNAFLN